MALSTANTYDKDDLIVGRGRLYFNRRKNGVYLGERYLGNTTELSMSSSVDKLDHYSSDHGFKDKDKTVNIENSRSGSFTTDIISHENVALWFGGDQQKTIFSAQNDVFEIVNGGAPVSKGFIYQLGVTEAAPQGQGGIDGASFTIGYADANTSISAGTGDIGSIQGVTVLSDKNYELDADRGQIYIEQDAPDITGEIKLVVKYNRKASSGSVIVSGDSIIEGALRFISDNPTGVQKNYYIPLITISADGDYALKGDDWQTLGFTFDILKRDAVTAPITIYDNITIGSGSSDGGTGGGAGDGSGNTGLVYSISRITFTPTNSDGTTAAGTFIPMLTEVVDQTGAAATSGVRVMFTVNNAEISQSDTKTDAGGAIGLQIKPLNAGDVTVQAIVYGGSTPAKEAVIKAV